MPRNDLFDLDDLLKRAKDKFDRMSPEQQDAMMAAQKKSLVNAEMSWPKPKFTMKDGVKVYDSYEDYVND